eukprot:Filipodium_phascolosomae@DN2559_c0_g1_i3.p1
MEDWTMGVHGLILTFIAKKPTGQSNSGQEICASRKYSGTFLPQVMLEHFNSKKATLEALLRKAGWHKGLTQEISATLKLVRYQGSLRSLTYNDYKETILPIAATEAADTSEASLQVHMEEITVPDRGTRPEI